MDAAQTRDEVRSQPIFRPDQGRIRREPEDPVARVGTIEGGADLPGRTRNVMHGPSLALWIVAASLGLAAQPSSPDIPAALEAARLRLDRGEGSAAVLILEDLLPAAGPDKEAVLGLLRKGYDLAARQADQAGRTREAETFRENLRIIARSPRVAASPAIEALRRSQAIPEPESAPVIPAPAPEPEPILPLPEVVPSGSPVEGLPTIEPDRTQANEEKVAQAPKSPEAPNPAELLPMAPESPSPSLATGDAAFTAERWAEASEVYAALAREGKLPEARRKHWAYCRSCEVARRINAKPKTDEDWASIDREIDQIRALDPGNWIAEYLRNCASERLAARKKAKPGKVVVRGSQPEEPPLIDRPVRKASTPPAPQASKPTTPPPAVTIAQAAASPAASKVGTPQGRWQVRETPNFRIYHVDPKLADQVGQMAESVRKEQTRRWTGAYPKTTWQPACEIYLYPTARQFAQMTGQPEESPGFSTMGMNEGRISARRVNLRVDHPGLLMAVLPHEVTHVILADHFTVQQIPRWADEGTAVLAEPTTEQERRAADLDEPLGKNVLFPVESLMGMDYPDNRFWALYYAQSVSLTRFLVEQKSPADLIQFLQGSQRHGYESELKRVYNIDGFPDLQARWVQYARANLNQKMTRTPATDSKVR